MQLEAITMRRATDVDPDTSHLGEFRSTFPDDAPDGAVIRHDPTNNRTHDYFVGNWRNYTGSTPEELRSYVKQDYERMVALNNEEWGYIGIWAEATINVGGTLQTIKSPGIWGVEDDAEDEYIETLKADELDELHCILEDMGFTAREYNNVEVQNA